LNDHHERVGKPGNIALTLQLKGLSIFLVVHQGHVLSVGQYLDVGITGKGQKKLVGALKDQSPLDRDLTLEDGRAPNFNEIRAELFNKVGFFLQAADKVVQVSVLKGTFGTSARGNENKRQNTERFDETGHSLKDLKIPHQEHCLGTLAQSSRDWFFVIHRPSPFAI
jgi:hypothetical protein